ncbi:cell division protein FtsK, partial [Streptococcus pneumoniae]|nr:cell division protein FtsK [Streptococcus pneumoniae]
IGIVDGKAAELFALGKLLQEDLGEQIAVGSSPQMLAKLSREFVEIMNERFEIIKQNSSLNADAYDLGMTPNFLFVDELASIRDSCGSSKQGGKELW